MKNSALTKSLLLAAMSLVMFTACDDNDDNDYIEEDVIIETVPADTTVINTLPTTPQTPAVPTNTANDVCDAPKVIPSKTVTTIPVSFPSAQCGTFIPNPLKLNLQKSTPDGVGPGLVLNVTIGKSPKSSNLLVDTGSASIVVSCTSVLPQELCTSDGIVLDNNRQDINGIIVTPMKTEASYGSEAYLGHVAYAPVTLNQTSQGKVSTGMMPILIWYKRKGTSSFDGVAGFNNGANVNANENAITLDSPIRYMNFASHLNVGLVIRPLGDISTWSIDNTSCLLTLSCNTTTDQFILGIDSATSNLFTQQTPLKSLASLVPNSYPQGVYSVTTNACYVLPNASYCQPTMFDTGTENSGYYMGPPAPTTGTTGGSGTGTTTSTAQPVEIPANSNVTITSANQQWTFNVGAVGNVTYAWNMASAQTTPLSQQLVGLPYFFENSYLLNFSTASVGVLMGQ